MSVCLSNHSAHQALEILAQANQELEPASSSILDGCVGNVDEAQQLLRKSEIFLDKPLELLVNDSRNSRSSLSIATHLCRTFLPDGAIKRIADGLYVASPELCLLQQACELNFIELCQLLGEFLAIATTSKSDGKNQLVDHDPLISEEELAAFMRNAQGLKGVTRLKQAMRWTLPYAASPQETNLQLLMMLPIQYGGFGFPAARLNETVELSALGERLCHRKTIRIDVAWPQKRGLEYQGDEHGNQLGDDYARDLAASHTGWKLWYVAKEQMADACQMQYIARLLASSIGFRVNELTWPTEQETQTLLDVLRGMHPLGKNERIRQQARVRRRS